MTQQIIEKIVGEIAEKLYITETNQKVPTNTFPIAVSARHIHLSQEHTEILFGKGYHLTKKVDLSQPNQFAAKETVTILGPKGRIDHVRVLGPARPVTQAEVSWTDALKIGVKPPLRDSGNISGSEAFTIIGPKAKLNLEEGMIIAQTHIHMKPQDAVRLNVSNNEYVIVEVEGIRPIAFRKVKVRVSDYSRLEMHIDTDEANACLVVSGALGRIIHSGKKHLRVKAEEEIREILQKNNMIL